VNGLPEPYGIGVHVVVRGNTVVIVDRAPNSDGWRYIGSRSDLAGGGVHFSHDEATPVQHPAPLTPSVNGILKLAGLDPDVYKRELAELQRENVEPDLTPLEELLSVVEHIARRGHSELRAALSIYREATS